MRIITTLANTGFPAFLERARAAERAGLYGIAAGDTPLFPDPYVSLAAAATVTSTLALGPVVTNPVTRHPAVTAAAISTLNDLSGGRAYLGLGAGDSSAHHRGLRPARLAEMRQAVEATRALLGGGPAEWDGKPVGAQWTGGPVPIMFAAGGHRSLRLAGEVADAALIAGGIDSAGVARAVATVREGEAAAGREPGTVRIWFVARTSITATREDGYERIKIVLSVAANHVLRSDLAAGTVPEALVDPVREYCGKYSYEHHGVGAANAGLFERLGLRNYIMDRFAVIGDGEHVAGAFSRLAGLGAAGVLVPAVGNDADELIARLGDEVVPRLPVSR